MNKVRAKFKVFSLKEYETQVALEATAVHGTKDENADFTKYTPSGKLEILIQKDAPAAGYLKPGDEFYIDLIKVEKAPIAG